MFKLFNGSGKLNTNALKTSHNRIYKALEKNNFILPNKDDRFLVFLDDNKVINFTVANKEIKLDLIEEALCKFVKSTTSTKSPLVKNKDSFEYNYYSKEEANLMFTVIESLKELDDEIYLEDNDKNISALLLSSKDILENKMKLDFNEMKLLTNRKVNLFYIGDIIKNIEENKSQWDSLFLSHNNFVCKNLEYINLNNLFLNFLWFEGENKFLKQMENMLISNEHRDYFKELGVLMDNGIHFNINDDLISVSAYFRKLLKDSVGCLYDFFGDDIVKLGIYSSQSQQNMIEEYVLLHLDDKVLLKNKKQLFNNFPRLFVLDTNDLLGEETIYTKTISINTYLLSNIRKNSNEHFNKIYSQVFVASFYESFLKEFFKFKDIDFYAQVTEEYSKHKTVIKLETKTDKHPFFEDGVYQKVILENIIELFEDGLLENKGFMKMDKETFLDDVNKEFRKKILSMKIDNINATKEKSLIKRKKV